MPANHHRLQLKIKHAAAAAAAAPAALQTGGRPRRLLVALSLVFACLAGSGVMTSTGFADAAISLYPPSEAGRDPSSYSAHGQHAAIATASPLASAAGLDMLKAGGNAIDAAVAASFVLAVVRPQSTGIGGGGFLLHYSAATKQVRAYDFRERAPAGATAAMYLDAAGAPADGHYGTKAVPNASVNGHLAVAVPGLVRGLTQLQAQLGKLPLKTVMAPAIQLARTGFPVYPGLARVIASRADILRLFPASAAIFLPGGKPLAAGALLVQTDLAWTLTQIAQAGEAAFYSGEISRRLVAEMQRGGGMITADDLKTYRTQERQPVTGHYRGFRLSSFPPPSSGGVHVIEMLNILAPTPYGALPFGQTASIHLLAETMRRAFADRAQFLGDPAYAKVPLAGLLSPAYGAFLRSTIDLTKATPSATLKQGQPTKYEHPETTHLSVVDAAGNAVSSTQTVNYSFGSCVVAAGTGIVLNDEMDDFSKKPGVANAFGLVGSAANAIAAGKTPLSSMAPTFVFTSAGKLRLVVGSPGGPRIISATLQTILNVIDHQMPLAEAVQATRIHHQWLPDELVYEPGGLSPSTRAELTRMGHHLTEDRSIGDVQAVELSPGSVTGASDTRSEGAALAY